MGIAVVFFLERLRCLKVKQALISLNGPRIVPAADEVSLTALSKGPQISSMPIANVRLAGCRGSYSASFPSSGRHQDTPPMQLAVLEIVHGVVHRIERVNTCLQGNAPLGGKRHQLIEVIIGADQRNSAKPPSASMPGKMPWLQCISSPARQCRQNPHDISG